MRSWEAPAARGGTLGARRRSGSRRPSQYLLSWAAPVCTVITMRRPYFTSLAVLLVPRRNHSQRHKYFCFFCFCCVHWAAQAFPSLPSSFRSPCSPLRSPFRSPCSLKANPRLCSNMDAGTRSLVCLSFSLTLAPPRKQAQLVPTRVYPGVTMGGRQARSCRLCSKRAFHTGLPQWRGVALLVSFWHAELCTA